MVSLTKLVIVLLLVLPCLLSVDAKKATCQMVSVSAKLTSSGRYNSYEATVRNAGDSTVSNLQLTTDADLRELNGLDESGNDKYTLSNTDSLEAGETYTFTYNVKKSSTVNWAVSCTTVTATPSKATPSTTTTKAPKKTTTTTTTTKAPKKPTTTKAPKAPSTQAPTAPSKAAPTTQKATNAPTAPSSAPSTGATAGSSNSNGGRTCSTGWWRPAPATTWQWQLTGTVDTTLDVQMYDIDLFDATPALINTLHSKGKTVICYFSTQYENWRPDAAQFPAATLGNNLDDWAGEKYLDIRSSVVRTIMTARMDLAVSKGCDGLEPDNVDGYSASTGFPITAADQINYNTFLANAAHARGLSVGLKNDGDQAAQLQPYFDWALNEQCNQYSECTALNVFITAGKAVFNCEYSGTASKVCPKMVTSKFSTLFKKLALDASVSANCCTYAPEGCVSQPHQCMTSNKRSVEEDPTSNVDENIAQEMKTSAAAPAYVHAPVVVVCAAAVAALALLF